VSHIGRKATLSLSVALALGVTTDTKVFAQDEPTLDEITVTGSRILRRDYTSQSPIVTVDASTFQERSNIGIETAMNQLPQFNTAGTQSQLSPANTPFPQATAAPGAATLDLRGIGLNRTLVLMDGRRVQPVNGLLVVDVNTIPAAAIERVEVITGGAAAVYGADAISGVVNFILKRDFEGLDVSAQYGVGEEGDGEEISINALFGADFSDGRGNVMVGADYSRREIIYGRDRDWVVAGWDDPGTNSGGIGSSNLSQFVPAGIVTAAPVSFPPATNFVVDQNGNTFNANDATNPAFPYTGPLGGGGDTAFKLNPANALGQQSLAFIDRENSFLQLPLERYALFGAGRYDLTDDIEAFTDVRFSETFASAQGFRSGVFNVWSPTVPYDPLYDDPDSPSFGQAPFGTAQHPVPAALADLLNSRMVDPDGPFGPLGPVSAADTPWTYVGGLDYLDNFRTETTTNVYQIIAGLRGDAAVGGRDWSWEVFASHGKTSVNSRQPEGFPYLPRIQNLFNADQYGENFDISSLPGFFPLAVTGHCTSGLPIFNPDGSVDDTPSVSKDCSDYAVLRMNNITTLTQEVVEGNVSGALADMWAGELLFAVGAAYRQEDFAFDPDSGFNANQDFPNVIQNIVLPVSVAGTTDVTEIYGELAIPLISDRKFVQLFEIDPGVRFSDYNTVGHIETYKATFDWTVNDRLKFRGGRQVANRAPNVTELFTPKGGSSLEFNAQDACGSWAQTQSWGNVPGNPNRFNLQTLCQHLMVRDGAPPSLYEPGQPSANTWMYNVFGATFNFPASLGVQEGNPGLTSEEAETYTFGVILSFDRVTLALDWFDIDLKDAIDTPAFATIYQQCMDPTYNSLVASAPGTYTGAELAAGNPYCGLINREYIPGAPTPAQGATGAARTFDARYINLGGVNVTGVDIQLDWGFDVGSAGGLDLSIRATILDEYAETAFPGAIPVDYTGTVFNSSFDYRTLTTLRYDGPSWSLGMRWQHLPSLDPQPGSAATVFGVNAHDQYDLFANWSFGERYSLRAGIDNLTNEDPEVVGRTTANNALGSTSTDYDTFGRRAYVGLSIDF
jgi:outer membrane receptor protein involved in Fe transport